MSHGGGILINAFFKMNHHHSCTRPTLSIETYSIACKKIPPSLDESTVQSIHHDSIIQDGETARPLLVLLSVLCVKDISVRPEKYAVGLKPAPPLSHASLL